MVRGGLGRCSWYQSQPVDLRVLVALPVAEESVAEEPAAVAVAAAELEPVEEHPVGAVWQDKRSLHASGYQESQD